MSLVFFVFLIVDQAFFILGGNRAFRSKSALVVPPRLRAFHYNRCRNTNTIHRIPKHIQSSIRRLILGYDEKFDANKRYS
jgi:hypothetical protein